MLDKMQDINRKISLMYNERFDKFGPTPEASLWFSEIRQVQRFQEIIRHILKVNQEEPISIADIGCGYGTFYKVLLLENSPKFSKYYGYDISSNAIKFCQKNFISNKVSFFISHKPNTLADFSVMSGTFNFSPDKNFSTWLEYFFECLKLIWEKTRIAMVFNLQISDREKITEQGIVYFNANEIISSCKGIFGETSVSYNKCIPNDATFTVLKS